MVPEGKQMINRGSKSQVFLHDFNATSILHTECCIQILPFLHSNNHLNYSTYKTLGKGDYYDPYFNKIHQVIWTST